MLIDEVLDAKGGNVSVIGPDRSISEAIDELQKNNIGSLVVIGEDKSILGLINERDIIHALSKQGAEILNNPVKSVMDTDVRTCARVDTVRQVLYAMTEFRKRHVPVVENGKLCGLVSIGDAVKHRLDETIKEANTLRSIMGTLGPG